jgi:hypothetical protein
MENIKQAHRNIPWYGGQKCKMSVLHGTIIDREGLGEASVLEFEHFQESGIAQ